MRTYARIRSASARVPKKMSSNASAVRVRRLNGSPLWPLWFAVAAVLAVTRALLTAHFLSDVLIGAGIGLLSARVALSAFFPGFAPLWF